MVKQDESSKTSSTNELTAYKFEGFIISGGFLPKTSETTTRQDPTGTPGYVVSGEVGLEYRSAHEWREPPHIAFANLRIEDPRSAEAFIKRYGVVHVRDRILDAEGRPTGRFAIDSAKLLAMQNDLRNAWKGSQFELKVLEYHLEQIAVIVTVVTGDVQLWPKDLWTLICFMFLRDYTAGLLGICGNPNCPAPYFKKKRRTQKICEAGPCVAYAQRQYSLAWWNREGKKKRKKKLAKRQH
jgi:hypothetical protein